jgi:hypothetical protein
MNRELKRTKEQVQRLIVLSNISFYSKMNGSVKTVGIDVNTAASPITHSYRMFVKKVIIIKNVRKLGILVKFESSSPCYQIPVLTKLKPMYNPKITVLPEKSYSSSAGRKSQHCIQIKRPLPCL